MTRPPYNLHLNLCRIQFTLYVLKICVINLISVIQCKSCLVSLEHFQFKEHRSQNGCKKLWGTKKTLKGTYGRVYIDEILFELIQRCTIYWRAGHCYKITKRGMIRYSGQVQGILDDRAMRKFMPRKRILIPFRFQTCFTVICKNPMVIVVVSTYNPKA